MTTVIWADVLAALPAIPNESVDAVVTDPPYALGFMGKAWDTHTPGGFQHWCELWATECLRILKPGGHLLAFGGTRTYHRLTAGIEDAGFEIRDSLHWLYGSGFPKSLDVSRAIDKAAGAEREVVGTKLDLPGYAAGNGGSFRLHGCSSVAELERLADSGRKTPDGRDARATLERVRASEQVRFGITAPATEAAQQWQGWGTALKPAHEPIVLARKPLQGTVAANVLQFGTGALNVDGCRVNPGQPVPGGGGGPASARSGGILGEATSGNLTVPHTAGRWPANVLLSHLPECVEDTCEPGCVVAELGAESRFFPVFRYQAKAPAKERPSVNGVKHPTVKPLDLMRWLVRLATPPGGLVLDPFAGSGTTLQAALLEGMRPLGVEREQDYLWLIKDRLDGRVTFTLPDTYQHPGERAA